MGCWWPYRLHRRSGTAHHFNGGWTEANFTQVNYVNNPTDVATGLVRPSERLNVTFLAAAPNTRLTGSRVCSGRASIASPTLETEPRRRSVLELLLVGAVRRVRSTPSITVAIACRPSPPSSSIASTGVARPRRGTDLHPRFSKTKSPGIVRGFFVPRLQALPRRLRAALNYLEGRCPHR